MDYQHGFSSGFSSTKKYHGFWRDDEPSYAGHVEGKDVAVIGQAAALTAAAAVAVAASVVAAVAVAVAAAFAVAAAAAAVAATLVVAAVMAAVALHLLTSSHQPDRDNTLP